MKTKKNVVINVEPCFMLIHTNTHGFTLEFRSRMSDGVRSKIINLRFEFWWARIIATQLWKAISFWRTEVERCADALTDDPDQE